MSGKANEEGKDDDEVHDEGENERMRAQDKT